MFKASSYKRKPSELDLVPMINIVFLLLIFFMLSSTAMSQNKEIELPEAETATLKSKSSLKIGVGPRGQVKVGDKTVSMDQLQGFLSQELEGQKDKLIEIKADKNTKFETFGKVIEISQQAGAMDFILATEKIKPVEY